MKGKIRKWCNYQRKCGEDTDKTWTCTAHLAEGRAHPCRAEARKVSVTAAGYYRHSGCADFEPPGYVRNDPGAFGMTLEQWYTELCRLAAKYDWAVCDDCEEYCDAWNDGTTPADYLGMRGAKRRP